MIKINVDDRKLWEPIKWFWRLIVRLRVGDHCLIQYTKGFFAKKFERYDLRSNWTVASWFKIEWIWVTDYIPNIRRKVRVMLGQAVQPGLSLFWWCGALRSCYSPLPMIPFLRAGLNLKVRERVLSNQYHVCDEHNWCFIFVSAKLQSSSVMRRGNILIMIRLRAQKCFYK